MQISEVKQQPLSLGSLLVAAFKIWLKLFVPYLKISVIFLIYALACLVLLLQTIGVSASLAMVLCVFMLLFLAIILQLVFLAFIPLCESAINEEKLFVFNAFESVGLNGVLKLLGVSILFVLINLACRVPLLLTHNPIIMLPYILLMLIVWTTVVIYLIFIPQAVILRGASIADSIKYSFYLVKDKWFKTFGLVFLSSIIQVVISSIIFGLMALLFFMMYGGAFKELIAAISSKNTMMILMLGLTLAKSLGVFAVVFSILSGFIPLYTVAAITALFINSESDTPEPAKHYEDLGGPSPLDVLIKEDAPAQEEHVFTEIFKNVREINISTKPEEDSASAIAPKNREEVLRHFEPLEITETPDPTPEQTMQNLVARIDDYPTAPIPGFQQRQPPAVKKDGDPKRMPTLEITGHDRASTHGLPSVVKPKSESN